MTTSEGIEMVLEPERFQGNLTINSQNIAIDLEASIDETGELVINVEPFSIPSSSIPYISPTWLYKSGKKDNTKIRLDCKSKSGKTIESDSIVISDYREQHDKNNLFKINLKLKTMQAKIRHKVPHRRNTPLLRFCVSNFNSPCDAKENTSLGTVKICSREIVLDAQQKHFSSCWKKKAKEQLCRMLTLMSFATGEELSLNMVKFYNKDIADITIFGCDKKIPPNTYPPIDPQFFEQFLKAAARTVENKEIDNDKWSAITRSINIMLAGSIYDELILVSQVIALVTLEGAYINLDNKIKKDENINQGRATLTEKIVGLIESGRWNIGESLIDDKERSGTKCNEVKQIQIIRDNITHCGKSYNKENEDAQLHDSIILSREIFNRIILSILGYKGSYFCFVGGRHIRSFPDLKSDTPPYPKLNQYTPPPKVISKIRHLLSTTTS